MNKENKSILVCIASIICLWILLSLFVYGISENHYFISLVCLPLLSVCGFIYIESLTNSKKKEGGGE